MTSNELSNFKDRKVFAQVAVMTNGNKFRVKRIKYYDLETVAECTDGEIYYSTQIEKIVECPDIKSLQ